MVDNIRWKELVGFYNRRPRVSKFNFLETFERNTFVPFATEMLSN